MRDPQNKTLSLPALHSSVTRSYQLFAESTETLGGEAFGRKPRIIKSRINYNFFLSAACCASTKTLLFCNDISAKRTEGSFAVWHRIQNLPQLSSLVCPSFSRGIGTLTLSYVASQRVAEFGL